MKFHLGLNCGSSVCQLTHTPQSGKFEDIRLDIQQMCTRLCLAAEKYYEEHHQTKDFSLYHTPVIDFVQWSREKKTSGKEIALVIRDKVLSRGLRGAFENKPVQVLEFSNPTAVRNYLKKDKPALWIIEGSFLEEKEQPWRIDNSIPVVVLKYPHNTVRDEAQLTSELYTFLNMPFSLKELCDSVVIQLSGEK